jgi:hypothetical protein
LVWVEVVVERLVYQYRLVFLQLWVEEVEAGNNVQVVVAYI